MADVFTDDFEGADGIVDGRVSPSGHTWSDLNDAARIASGRFIRNPAQEGESIGVYGAVVLSRDVKQMTAQVSWVEAAAGASDIIQENGALVLICGSTPERSGAPPNISVYKDCIHAVFGPWQTSITTYTAGVASAATAFTYPAGRLAVDGTVYSVGLTLDGNRVGVKPPDRTRYEWIGKPNYDAVTGKYMIWQTFNSNAPDLRPRFESVYATSDLPTYALQQGLEVPYGLNT